jgi:hypothetical protein
MADEQVQIFRREASTRITYDVVITIFAAACMWFFIEFFFLYSKSDVLTGQIVSLGMFAFAPLLFWGRIYISDIYINNEGIEWWLWGKRRRYIRWNDVKAMTIDTIIIRNYLVKVVTSYCLYTTEKRTWINSQLHGMRFDGDMPNVDKLVAAIMGHLIEHNVPVIDSRMPGH